MSSEKRTPSDGLHSDIAAALNNAKLDPIIRLIGKDDTAQLLIAQTKTNLRCQAIAVLQPFAHHIKGDLHKALVRIFPEIF